MKADEYTNTIASAFAELTSFTATIPDEILRNINRTLAQADATFIERANAEMRDLKEWTFGLKHSTSNRHEQEMRVKLWDTLARSLFRFGLNLDQYNVLTIRANTN